MVKLGTYVLSPNGPKNLIPRIVVSNKQRFDLICPKTKKILTRTLPIDMFNELWLEWYELVEVKLIREMFEL